MTDRRTRGKRSQLRPLAASQRHAAGYAAAADAIAALAAAQPGFCGIDSVRGADGAGITASWWADEASALVEHSVIRVEGRARCHAAYEVALADVRRSYRWERT